MTEIDVSKCEHYDNGFCDKYFDVECADHPACKYKQLLQLKATLDEIEKIAKDKLNEGCSIRNKDCDFSCNKCLFDSLNEILQLIKQAKEGE